MRLGVLASSGVSLIIAAALLSCAGQRVEHRVRRELAHWKIGDLPIVYPVLARRVQAQGFVLVGYTVQPDGEVVDPFAVRAVIKPRLIRLRGEVVDMQQVLVDAALTAAGRRRHTPVTRGFEYREKDAVSRIAFVMPPVTAEKEPCRPSKAAAEFDPARLRIRFGVIEFDDWGHASLVREVDRVPLVPLREDASVLYGVHIDNPDCHTFVYSTRWKPSRNPGLPNRGGYLERTDPVTGEVVCESPEQVINTTGVASVLTLRADDVVGPREHEVLVNGEPFARIQYEIEAPR